jgi:hypothetical protein
MLSSFFTVGGWQNGWIEDTLTGLAIWLVGLGSGMVWAHRKIVRPAADRHQEQLRRLDHVIKHSPDIPDLPQ